MICHPVARIDIAYSCTKFDDFTFSRSNDMIVALIVYGLVIYVKARTLKAKVNATNWPEGQGQGLTSLSEGGRVINLRRSMGFHGVSANSHGVFTWWCINGVFILFCPRMESPLSISHGIPRSHHKEFHCSFPHGNTIHGVWNRDHYSAG